MSTPTLDAVRAYYDGRVEGRIRDFTDANPRIEAAIQTLAEWAPPNPKRILEIGCGIGATTWRMARAWPQAEVIGTDISSTSIDVAKRCFQRSNLLYCAGLPTEGAFQGHFDLILMMDVYEHIAIQDRAAIHATIVSLLSEDSRVVMTVPTPVLQNYDRIRNPVARQPVDEDVTPADVIRLTDETRTRLLYYREVGVWQYGDYLHVVLGRYQELAEVAVNQCKVTGLPALKQRIKSLLSVDKTQSPGRHDYLGWDTPPRSSPTIRDRFQVSASERRRLVSSWRGRSDHQSAS